MGILVFWMGSTPVARGPRLGVCAEPFPSVRESLVPYVAFWRKPLWQTSVRKALWRSGPRRPGRWQLVSPATLAGHERPFLPGSWTKLERKLVNAVGLSVKRLLGHGQAEHRDFAALEKELRSKRVNYAGEESPWRRFYRPCHHQSMGGALTF